MMDDAEAKNIISMDVANYALQQAEELHGLSSQADVSEVTTFMKHKTFPEAEEVEITTVINPGANTLQIAEELDEKGGETKISGLHNTVLESCDSLIYEHGEVELIKETTLLDANAMFGAEEVEDTGSVDLLTDNTLQLLNEVHQKDDEIGISLLSTEPSNKVYESDAKSLSQCEEKENGTSTYEATNPGRLEEDHSINDSRELRVEYVKLVPNDQHELQITVNTRLNDDGIENIISTGQAAGGSSQQGHEPEFGTFSSIQVLVEETKEAVRELVNTEMDEKLKKIEEHVLSIDTEISRLELQCSESKGRHADFIDLYTLVAESQLPLRSHRKIRLFMKKTDKAAQRYLSNAIDLQINIEARTKLKLTLQEEIKELVEAQKLQKLNQTEEEEVVYPKSTETTTISSQKRKAYREEEELCAPVQAKRTALDVVTDP